MIKLIMMIVLLPSIAVGNTVREVTAYNVGDKAQTDSTPCISASGENICRALEQGKKRCAANFVPFGTILYIKGYGACRVTDRMNKRYRNRVDIAMKKNQKKKAKKFGKQKLYVKVMN